MVEHKLDHGFEGGDPGEPKVDRGHGHAVGEKAFDKNRMDDLSRFGIRRHE